MKVHASGCTRSIALTTVKPSPGSPMFKSDSRTSNFCVLICSRASGTLLTDVSRKPRWVNTAPSAVLNASSSSTNNSLISAIGSWMRTGEGTDVRHRRGFCFEPGAEQSLTCLHQLHISEKQGRNKSTYRLSLAVDRNWFQSPEEDRLCLRPWD